MKLSHLVLSLGASSVVVSLSVPSPQTLFDAFQLNINDVDGQQDEDDSGWWDSLVSSIPNKDTIKTLIQDSNSYLASNLDNAKDTIQGIQKEIQTQLNDITSYNGLLGGPGGHDYPDHTIYELICKCKHTSKFAKLVDEYPSVVKLLNSTKTNHTLFVPINSAFDKIPDDHKKPSKEFVEDLLLYHIGLGDYSAHKIFYTDTMPSALKEKDLGDEPQRLRTSVGLGGVRVNFYSKVVAADIGAKNGIIHAVGNILVPPPYIGRIFNLFPSEFSTLLLAYEKTDFVKYLHGIKTDGCTAFAPSNSAFAWLGPKANAFLFNTETGLKCLKALLKYHIAPNATLYSDAFYDETDGTKSQSMLGREHFDLGTLLNDANVAVDIYTIAGFRSLRVNGFSHVSIRDAVGRNGVIQVIDHVLLPPKKHNHKHHSSTYGDVDIEDLKERLLPYTEEDETADDEFNFEL